VAETGLTTGGRVRGGIKKWGSCKPIQKAPELAIRSQKQPETDEKGSYRGKHFSLKKGVGRKEGSGDRTNHTIRPRVSNQSPTFRKSVDLLKHIKEWEGRKLSRANELGAFGNSKMRVTWNRREEKGERSKTNEIA